MRTALPLLLGLLLLPSLGWAGDDSGPVAASEDSADDPPELDDTLRLHVQRRAALNGVALGVLGGWSVASMVGGGVGMATTSPGTTDWSFHQMNLVWGGIDLAIAGAAGAWIAVQTRHPGDEVSILRGGNRLQILYALNLGLDIGYVATGLLLQRLGTVEGNPTLEGYGPAIALQGGVLLALDTILLIGNAALDDRLLARRRTWAKLPPRLRAPLPMAGLQAVF